MSYDLLAEPSGHYYNGNVSNGEVVEKLCQMYGLDIADGYIGDGYSEVAHIRYAGKIIAVELVNTNANLPPFVTGMKITGSPKGRKLLPKSSGGMPMSARTRVIEEYYQRKDNLNSLVRTMAPVVKQYLEAWGDKTDITFSDWGFDKNSHLREQVHKFYRLSGYEVGLYSQGDRIVISPNLEILEQDRLAMQYIKEDALYGKRG